MLARFVRMAVQMVLFFLLLGVVLAVAAPTTGTGEKVALAAVGVVLLVIAFLVHRMDHQHAAPG